ncbi:MAG: hypothetical protein WC906_00515 [Parcubacteria group bacterium]|jgi:thioredoxin-related protein
MNKKIFIVMLVIIAIGGIAFFAFKNKNDNSQKIDTGEKNANIILFYWKGCPHCENVDKFIQENKVKEKIQFDELEIFYEKNNAKLMEEKAGECGIDTKELGVPFLWNSGKCFSGDADIINFLKSQLGEQQ